MSRFAPVRWIALATLLVSSAPPAHSGAPTRARKGRHSLRFYGGAKQVTGSLHILRVARPHGRKNRSHLRVLIDAGLPQGRDAKRWDLGKRFPKEIRNADALLLTHIHIDHSGLIPKLVKEGFKGQIFATESTTALAPAMLEDSARIMKKRKGGALYDYEDTQRALERFEPRPFHETFELVPGVAATFSPAGHVLGAAISKVDIEGGPSITFTGDIGRAGTLLLPDPSPVTGSKYVVSESTYGDRLHKGGANPERQLRGLVHRAAQNQGKLIIPAFSLGRTQSLVLHLNRLRQRGEIPELPIYVDSPLSVRVTRIHELRIKDHGPLVQEMAESGNPYEFDGLEYVVERDMSKILAEVQEPGVIISSSGMGSIGRIVRHLHHAAPYEQNIIALAGYAAEGTTARALADGESVIEFKKGPIPLRAQVEIMRGTSGHADQREMRRTLRLMGPEEILLTHGDSEVQATFAKVLRQDGHRVRVPARNDVVELE